MVKQADEKSEKDDQKYGNQEDSWECKLADEIAAARDGKTQKFTATDNEEEENEEIEHVVQSGTMLVTKLWDASAFKAYKLSEGKSPDAAPAKQLLDERVADALRTR